MPLEQHFPPKNGVSLSSEEFAEALDTWLMRPWPELVAKVEATGISLVDQLHVLTQVREVFLARRECARSNAIASLRAKGAQVADDFGLPCRVLQLIDPRTACAGEA